MKKIHVLHEYGAPSHYSGLVALGKKCGFKVDFYIFSPKAMIKHILKGDFRTVFKSIIFLLSLPFIKRTKIVLGIAPYNFLLVPLTFLLKKHLVYYHTSYTHWDGEICAHHTKFKWIKKIWKKYIMLRTKHIFVVSKKSKDEIIDKKYAVENQITIVNHSYPDAYMQNNLLDINSDRGLTFLYVGRLIESKGIEELLTIFSKNNNLKLTIVGDGPLKELVKNAQKRYTNIKYLGYVGDKEQLKNLYNSHSFLLLNSKKTQTWEELFGMVLIEGQINGCIPIATNHPGPLEIIENNNNGFLTNEGLISEVINYVITLSRDKVLLIRKNAINSAKMYCESMIANRWKKILD